ncbi:alpha-amylase family glycosyl hydrolase [Marinifilum caeruleilacunae]|uniref:Alpha-amylase n=1 Tax=Marinifilum caeruleilacunae TaxID=2499076 RepID=A0ABX1WW48_9BACT|nr:alpha-amylase family glycosyl hydrolase [Marinifilum caeruleilacunae]NOU60166.1 alpha-amylase [Marinifilum caeruleilacunae]
MTKEKIIIYQLLPRLFGNKNTNLVLNGSRVENGSGKFSDITHKALREIKKMGVNHIWYTGIIEHAIAEGYPEHGILKGNPLVIKGKAGSPYAIADYYDVNPDLSDNVNERMEEFQELVSRTHQNGMKAIIDFVPNHLAREYKSDKNPKGTKDFGEVDDKNKSFSATNNYYYLPNEELKLPQELQDKFPNQQYTENPAKATGNDQFSAYPNSNDWYETVKLNYGIDYLNGHAKHFDPIPDTWHKMKDILLYWAQKGVDGFRCDMAEMVPVEFWNWAIGELKHEFPDILFIAEVYNPQLYESYIRQGKFDYLYDKVGLYDTLKAVIRNEQPARNISNCWQALNGLDQHMLRFLENHDEQRIASRFFSGETQKAIPAMMVSTCLHKGPAMIYFGQEVGEPAVGESGFSGDDGRTTIFDYWNVPEHQKWMNGGAFDEGLLSASQINLRKSYAELLQLGQEPAISTGEFYDIMWQNTNMNSFNSDRIYAFLRHTKNQKLLIICNFDSQTQFPHVVIPSHALEVMQIPRPIKISLTDKLSSYATTIGTEELINQGVKLEISAYNSLILELKY